MLQMSRTAKFGLIVIVAFVLAFLYIPLFVVVVNSFNEAQLSSWPVQNFSLYWWEFAATYEPIRLALLNSVIVATAAMVIASILGTLVAFALGISLFVLTLGLNIVALAVVRKYREQYE